MKEQNENLNLNLNLNVNEAKENTMKEQNENLNLNLNLNVNEAMSAEETQEWLYAIGEAEEEASYMAKDFALYLEKVGIKSEAELKEWACDQLLWQPEWPGPRTIWQQITKGTTESEGKKTHWKVFWTKTKEDRPYRAFRIEYGKERELFQEFALSLVAGLGKVAGVLASRKKRAGNSTVPGTSTATGTTSESSTGTACRTSSKGDTGTEVEKLKQENASLYKEVEDLRASQTKAYDKAKGEFSALLEASAKREKSANEVAEKVKGQATGMDECIIKALSALNEAKSSQTKEKLLAIIAAAKAALAEAPKLEIGEPEQAKEK